MSRYSDLILATPGLVSYWRLGEAAGQAIDTKAVVNGNVTAGMTRSVPGLLSGDGDRAIQSPGTTGNRVTFANHANLVTAAVSVECWVQPTAVGAGAESLVKRDVNPGGYELEHNGSGRWMFYAYAAGGQRTAFTPVSTAVSGVTQHIVATYSAADRARIYVNGVLIHSAASAGAALGAAGSTTLFATDLSAPSLAGVLDEVAIYNTVLTAQQILDHYTVGITPTVYTDAPSGMLSLSGTMAESYLVGWVGLVRELPPLRISIDAIAPNGRHYRWGLDEPRAENVFSGLRWGSTMPGGHESMDCVLPRKPGSDYADLDRLSTLRVLGVGGNVVGEFRLERSPQTSGDQMAISPSAVGWQAHLDDNKGVSVIFIDRDLGGWRGPAAGRMIGLGSTWTPVGPEQRPDVTSGLPGLEVAIDGEWAAYPLPLSEGWYDAGPGNMIGQVRGNFAASPSITNAADPNWVWALALNSTDNANAGDGYATHVGGAATGSVTRVATTATRRFAMIQMFYATGPGNTVQARLYVRWTYLRVFGLHNLTIRGTTPQTEGFWCSDVVKYAVARWAPKLRITEDSFQPTNFIIPQLTFRDNTTVSNIISQSTRFGLEDWAVWNDKTFYLSPRNANPLAKNWRARVGPARLEQTGQQMDRLWESILVQYNDVDGSTRVVGPPGSGADTEDARLKDSDPSNPANIVGITRRDKLVMGISTPAAAITVGRRFLEEQKAIDRSGRAALVGHVMDDHGALCPYSEVKAGDNISFIDAADTSYRRIVKASHDEGSKTVSVDLDAPPEGLQAVLERLGVVLAPLGL